MVASAQLLLPLHQEMYPTFPICKLPWPQLEKHLLGDLFFQTFCPLSLSSNENKVVSEKLENVLASVNFGWLA